MSPTSGKETSSSSRGRPGVEEGEPGHEARRFARSKTPIRDFFRRDKSLTRKEEEPIVSVLTSPKPTKSITTIESDPKLVESPSDIVRRSPFRQRKNNLKGQIKNGASPKSVIASANRAQEEERTCTYDIDPTILYKLIEFRAWDETVDRIVQKPTEVETWVLRYDQGKKLRWKMLPLHAAILFRAPFKVIQALIKAFPEAAQMHDDRQMFPIHIACSVLADADVTQLLVDLFPPSLLEVDLKGRSPDDILIEAGKRQIRNSSTEQQSFKEIDGLRELLLKALEKYDLYESDDFDPMNAKEAEEAAEDEKDDGPDDVEEEHDSNHTPESAVMEYDYDKNPTLLTKLLEEKRWKDAITRCKQYPREAATWMCRYHVGPAAHGKGSEKVLRWKILPIHSAVVLNAPIAVIKTLIETYPVGVYQGDDRAMLPIHIAFRLSTDLDICKALVDAYPKSLHHPDNRGVTPLQILKEYRREYRKSENLGNKKKSAPELKRKVLFQYFLAKRETTSTIADGREKIDSTPSRTNAKNSPVTTPQKRVNFFTPKRKGVAVQQSASPIESILNEMDPGRCYAPKDLMLMPSDSIVDDDYDDEEDDSSNDDLTEDDDTSTRMSSVRDPNALFYDGVVDDLTRLTLGSLPDLFLCGSGRKR